jgi:uncharacterized protein (TIGR03437 family)
MLVSAVAYAQPVIQTDNGVVNASSELADIARGSWFVVKGTGLGPSAIVVQSGPPYPAVLSGTSITFTPAAGGTPVSALMYYTLAQKVAALLPSSTPAGAYDVKVTYNGATSAAKRVNVVERNFGYATQSSNGQGPAQATYGGLDLNRFTTGTLDKWALRPAKPGDAMVLWGTGLGADAASDASGGTSGDQTSAGQVRVIVGGTEVTPAYAGRSGGSPGLDQVNFTVPTNVTPSCFVSLQVRAGGRLSNLGSIAVAAAGATACSHPSLSEVQLKRLDAGGTVTIGTAALVKSSIKLTVPVLGTVDSKSESVSASFGKYAVDGVATANFSMLQSGACFLFQRTGTQDQVTSGPSPTMLDAGAQLTINGPNLSNKAMPRQTDKSYNLNLYSSGIAGFGGSGSPTFGTGTYTLAGTGGADVGAFSGKVDFPADFTWTNQDTIANPVPRSQALNVTWTGGGTGLVTIVGTAMSTSNPAVASPIYSATIFSCVAPATASNFSVPANIMAQMPVVSGDATSGSFGTLSVFAVSDSSKGQGTFTAPLTAGGSIDQGVMSITVGNTKTTGYN